MAIQFVIDADVRILNQGGKQRLGLSLLRPCLANSKFRLMNRLVCGKLILMCLLPSYLLQAYAYGTQSGEIVAWHPTPENLPEVTDPQFILHEVPGLTFIDEQSHEKITIGVEDGEFHEMFGFVSDLAVPGDGTVLVLDRVNSEVRVFDYGGILLATFGRLGEGPGEFRKEPYKISIADQGKSVFVLEQFGRTASVFDRLEMSTFAPKVNSVPGVLSFSGCAMNGHYWVYGYDLAKEGVVHKFDYDGQHVATFAERYKAVSERASSRLSFYGDLACSEAHGIVALNRVWAPVITGYRDNGEIAWHVKFAGIDVNYIPEHEDGKLGLSHPYELGQRRFDYLFTDPAGDFYVQYTIWAGRGLDRRLDRGPLFKVDAATGLGTYLGTAPTLSGYDAGYGFSVFNHPFPHVVIYRPRDGINHDGQSHRR